MPGTDITMGGVIEPDSLPRIFKYLLLLADVTKIVLGVGMELQVDGNMSIPVTHASMSMKQDVKYVMPSLAQTKSSLVVGEPHKLLHLHVGSPSTTLHSFPCPVH